MDLIGLYFIQTLKQRFNPKRQPWNLVGLVFFIGFGALYGFLFGKVLNEAGSLAKKETVLVIIQWVLMGGILLFSFVKTFIPYKTLPTSFSRHLPIRHIQRLCIGLIGEFLTPFFLGVLSFLVLFYILSKQLPLAIFINAVSVLIGALVARRIFQLALERHWSKGYHQLKWAALLTGTIGFLVLLSPLYKPVAELFSFSSVIGLIFLIPSLYLTESYICVIPKERRPFEFRWLRKAPLHLKLLLGGSKSRMMVLFSIFYKVIFVAFFASMGEAHEGSDNFLVGGADSLIVIILLMPVTLFSYIFYNVWGFLPNFWLFIERSSTQPKDIFMQYVHLIKWPLLLDYLLMGIYCVMYPEDAITLHLGYLLVVLFGLGLGFLVCALSAKRVTKAFKMGGNTPPWANFLTFIPAGIAYLIRLNHWFYGLYVLFFLLSLALIYYAMESYKTKRQQIYQKLFS